MKLTNTERSNLRVELMNSVIRAGADYLRNADIVERCIDALSDGDGANRNPTECGNKTFTSLPAIEYIIKLVAHLSNMEGVSISTNSGKFTLIGRDGHRGMFFNGSTIRACLRAFADSEHCNQSDVEFGNLKSML